MGQTTNLNWWVCRISAINYVCSALLEGTYPSPVTERQGICDFAKDEAAVAEAKASGGQMTEMTVFQTAWEGESPTWMSQEVSKWLANG